MKNIFLVLSIITFFLAVLSVASGWYLWAVAMMISFLFNFRAWRRAVIYEMEVEFFKGRFQKILQKNRLDHLYGRNQKDEDR